MDGTEPAPHLHQTGQAGATIEIRGTTASSTTAKVNADGNWSAESNIDLAAAATSSPRRQTAPGNATSGSTVRLTIN